MESLSFLTKFKKTLLVSAAPRVRRTRGFTLIEMLVVLAIIVILISIILVGQTTFNRTLILVDTTYTVALSLREAETLGVSSQQFSGISNAAYGVHFSNGTPKTYQLFADIVPSAGDSGGSLNGICPGHSVTDPTNPEARPGNCIFDSLGDGEQVQSYSFSRGYYISNICTYDSNGTAYCSSAGQLTDLHITFARPNEEAIIVGSQGSTFYSQDFVKAVIHIAPPQGGAERCVVVTQLGEIIVNSTCT